MNKVITINLNGNAFSLEENGYEALREYLDQATRRLEGNPDKEEIMADIEQAIADKFRGSLGPYKTVVVAREVEKVIVEMGPVQDASGPADDGSSAAAASGTPFLAEEFIRRAKAGYYEGMRTFHDKRAHREWKRRFKREMRGWKKDFQWQMREHASQWKRNWRHGWMPPHPHPIGALVLLPFIALLQSFFGLLAFCFVISYLATGTLFGWALPFGLHGWIGLVFLIVVYAFLVWPIKALGRACFYGGAYGYGFAAPFYFLWTSVLWAGFVIFAVWLANRYIPQAHAALQNLPPLVHHAADSVRQWWSRR